MKHKPSEDLQLGVHVRGNVVLKEARYLSLPSINGDQQMKVHDDISYSNVSLNGFSLLYTRKVCLHPESFFEVSVAYASDVVFEDEAGHKVLKTPERVHQWIEDNIIRIVNTFYLPDKASLLISSISSSAGFEPIITQPTYLPSQE